MGSPVLMQTVYKCLSTIKVMDDRIRAQDHIYIRPNAFLNLAQSNFGAGLWVYAALNGDQQLTQIAHEADKLIHYHLPA